MNKKRVAVGMSGRVDSSVTTWLLKQQGYDVVGLFVKNQGDGDDSECCSVRQNWTDMVSVVDLIGVDIEAANFAVEYKDRVFADFLRKYSTDRTPNPDVFCGAEIKFKAFLDHATAPGAGAVATEHYAHVRRVDGRFGLLTAFDHTKDQSYFLHRLSQAQLLRTFFPLDEMPKTKVRKITAGTSLPNAKKRDPTRICFAGGRPLHDFLSRYLPTRPGPVKTSDGKTTGEHVDLALYTLGQCESIGTGGSRDDNGDAWYVARKDIAVNTLYVVQRHDHPRLLTHTVHAGDLSWVVDQAPIESTSLGAKTRYRQANVPHTVVRADDDTPTLAPPEAQWAVTSGQSTVLYDGEACPGDGAISTTEPAVVEKAIT